MPRFINLTIIFLISFIVSTNGFGAKIDSDKKFTVVIDAGHGGKDIGATDNGVMEKNINLKVAKQLEGLIKKKLKNVKVVMTRDDDTYLTLQQRADKANKSQGDLFISIHTNSVDKRNKNRKTVAGSSVYTLGLHKDENNLQVAMRENSVIELENDYEQKYSGFDPQRDESYIIFEMAQKKNLSQSIRFAESVEKELVASGRQNRGVHQAGFWVLWATSMPSVLVELDFICNPESAKYMTSDSGVKELAQAIFNAVEVYIENSNKPILSAEPIKEEPVLDENVAVVSTRRKKTTTEVAKPQMTERSYAVSNQGKRRRRSQAGKTNSANAIYESESLAFSGAKNNSGIEIENDNNLFIASEMTSVAAVKENNKKEKASNKNKQDKKKRKEKTNSHNAKVNKLVTVYKIQLLSSADLLNQGNDCFCGLSPISAYKENNLYKYYYGESTDRGEIEAVLADVRKKIPDAFIVSSKKSVQTK